MGLFTKLQMEQINAAAKRSKELAEAQSKPKGSGKSINSQIASISEKVREHFKDSDAELISSIDQLHDYISNMITAGIGALDTETTGLDRVNDTIVGMSLYYPGGVEVYIPFTHIVPVFETPYPNQFTYEEVAVELQRLIDAKVRIIMANADFDIGMLFKDLHVDFLAVIWMDVILAWRCIKEDEKDNSLKGLVTKYLFKGQIDRMKFSDFFTAKLFPYCDPQVAKLYAAADAKYTYDLGMWMLPYLTKDSVKCKRNNFEAISDLVWGIEFPLISAMQLMHRRGIYLEPSAADMLKRKYHPILEGERTKIQEMVAELMNDPKYYTSVRAPFRTAADFNANSTQHVQWLCYDVLRIPLSKNKRITDKDYLSTFDHPVIKQILKIRSFVTVISTFVDKLPGIVGKDQKIHCSFKSIGADCVTGNTIIATDSGFHRIDELCSAGRSKPGQLIDVTPFNIVNKDQVYESATSVIYYADVPTIKITTSYGLNIEGTPNHPVMVSGFRDSDLPKYRNGWTSENFWKDRKFKTLSDIQVGDIIEIPCNYKTSATYQPTNFVPVLIKASNRNVVTIPTEYTEDFAELLGMYHADGSSDYHDGTFRFQISNKNPEVINRFTQLSESLFGLTPNTWVDRKRPNVVNSYVTAKGLMAIEPILSHGALNKKIPDAIMKSPDSVIQAYIRGMTLDCCVYRDSKNSNKVKMELNVANETDCDFLQMYFMSKGILCSRVYHCEHRDPDHAVTPRLKFSSNDYMKFRDFIGFIESHKYCETIPSTKNSKRRIGDSFYVVVKSVQHSHNDVYDLHVPETHSFVSNGFISHNTGRMSSKDPNMQNIPSRMKDIRHMFRATPGYVMLSSDYSQQEPKLVAFISQDENMIKAFQEGKDIYATIAAIAFGKSYEECLEFTPTGEYNPEGKARRTEAKSVVLGILYGRSIPSIADQLYSHEQWSDEKKVKQAQFVYDSVLAAFPALKKFMISAQKMAHDKGYVETILGRRRHIRDMMLPEFEFQPMPGYVNPDIDPLDPSTFTGNDGIPKRIQDALYKELTGYKYFGQKAKRIKQLAEEEHIKVINNSHKIQEASRQCVNSIIQGSAAELTKMAMLKVEADPVWQNLGGRILVPVHDEFIAEVPIEHWKEGGERLAQLMCEAANFLPFSIKCDVTTSYRWYGLEYPCPYPETDNVDTEEPEEVKYIQYHLFEVGYELPVFKGPNGEKPEGNEALGVNGRITDEYLSYIQDYCNRYNIQKDQFLYHIHTKVHTGYTPDELKAQNNSKGVEC